MPAAHETIRIVPESAQGARLDAWLARELGVGRRAIVRMQDRIRCNGRRAIKGLRLRAGDLVEVLPAPESALPAPTTHRSVGNVVVFAKPAGLPTLSLAGDSSDSLAARIAAHMAPAADALPPESGLVQRLDTGTSGLLLAGTDEGAVAGLRAQMHGSEWEKAYLCIVSGSLTSRMLIDTAIGQHPNSRRRMRAISDPTARSRYRPLPACSRVEPLATRSGRSLVRVRTTTGHRHQVRVHLASIGHPILGDTMYGGELLRDAPGHCLHAESIRWIHPATGSTELDSHPPPTWWPAWT